MLGAYLSFLSWAAKRKDLWEGFAVATGLKLPESSSVIECMIDRATGFEENVATHFIKWVTENYWGVDDAPAVYYKIIAGLK